MYRHGSSRRETVVNILSSSSPKDLFKAYYTLGPRIKPPENIERREFAFQLFESDTYVRHISFSSLDELMRYLADKAPRNAYYSVAVYELPEAPRMEEKGWLGSEVMVDIDVDHVEGCGVFVGDECLVRGYNLALKVDSILRRDFGVKPEIYFTGNRGFHIVFSCDWCMKLGREERREIAAYLAAEGLEQGLLFPLRAEGVRGRRRLLPAPPDPEDPGWRGWIAREARVSGWKPGDPLPPLGVPIDSMVTQDPTRLSRLRGSLNGKGGMIVTTVGRTGFRPDRSLSPFRGEVILRSQADIEGVILGVNVSMKRGEESPLPAYAAVVLWLRGLARPVGGEVVVRADTSWRPV